MILFYPEYSVKHIAVGVESFEERDDKPLARYCVKPDSLQPPSIIIASPDISYLDGVHLRH